jgi:branched-chain amino acid transport system ATP-binding protein
MALLEVRDVSVRFGGILAVDRVSFELDAGSVTGLIGPNGAGKTTSFNVITGLQQATSGEIWFEGHDISRARVDRRARMGMGRTFQRLEAFGSMTVRENIAVAREILAGPRAWLRNRHDPVVDDLVEQIGLSPYVDVRADLLPTGVARLLELARALAIEPRLLLLDEPSSGLDESETAAFGALLAELAGQGMAILMVEHDMDLVFDACHWIHVLEFGRIIASGTAAQIRNDPVVQAAYLGNEEEIA